MISTLNSLPSIVVMYFIFRPLVFSSRGLTFSALPVHPFPTPDPFPVGCIALITLDELRGKLGFLVSRQGGQDGGYLLHGRIAALLHGETLLYEARVILPAHK